MIETRCETCRYWSRPTATEVCYMTDGCVGWCGRADTGPIKNLQMGKNDCCSQWKERVSNTDTTNINSTIKDIVSKLDLDAGNISRLFENTDEVKTWLLRLVKFFECYFDDLDNRPGSPILSPRDFKLREFMYKIRREMEDTCD